MGIRLETIKKGMKKSDGKETIGICNKRRKKKRIDTLPNSKY